YANSLELFEEINVAGGDGTARLDGESRLDLDEFFQNGAREPEFLLNRLIGVGDAGHVDCITGFQSMSLGTSTLRIPYEVNSILLDFDPLPPRRYFIDCWREEAGIAIVAPEAAPAIRVECEFVRLYEPAGGREDGSALDVCHRRRAGSVRPLLGGYAETERLPC